MKIKSWHRHILSVILLGLIITFANSCKKDEANSESIGDGIAKLVFTVQNIDNKAINAHKQAGTTPVDMIKGSSTENQIKTSNKKINLISSASEGLNETYFNGKGSTSPGLNKIAATEYAPVHESTRYRLVLYNITKNKIEKNVEHEASKSLEIAVTPGDEYRWFAYSYNTAESVDEPIIENGQPHIMTKADRELLWTKSINSIVASTQAMPLMINFDHRAAEVVLELDTRNLYGEITDLAIDFDQEDYFNTAKINLQTGDIVQTTPYSIGTLNKDHFTRAAEHPAILEKRLYTAQPQNKIETLKIHIKKLTIRQENGDISEIQKVTDPAKTVEFTFTAPHVSKSHTAGLKMAYKIPAKTILHVTGTGNDDDLKWAFTAQPGNRATSALYSDGPDLVNGRAPYNMLKQKLNYGALSNSIIHTDGFNHVRCFDGVDELATKLANKPDIVIITLYYTFSNVDISALINYINQGGVVIMFSDSAIEAEKAGIQKFLQDFLGNTLITVDAVNNYNGGSFFKLSGNQNINDMILNGPFGDIRNGNWGVDTHNLLGAQNLPVGTGANDVTLYSSTQAINRADISTVGAMFKHNTKSFFWIGNGSFLSTPNGTAYGWSTGLHGEPFATISASRNQPNPDSSSPYTHDHFPVPKRYGQSFDSPTYGKVGYDHGTTVHNAPLFANLMAWALYQSEFYGINKN